VGAATVITTTNVSLAVTEADDTAVGAVQVAITSALAATEANDTVVGAATNGITLDTLDLQLQITLLNNSLNISIVKELELIVSTK